MATVEFAELGAELGTEQTVADLGFPHWVVMRRCALGLYVIALVAYTAAYGIPVQRELVVAWTCGALACVSIGRPPREILQLVVDWLPMVVILSIYDFTRGGADSLGIEVHMTAMIDFDRFVFFGQTPTEWLQARLYDRGVVHWWDVVFTLVYTSYFIVPFAIAGVLWARDRLAFLRFVKRLVTLAAGRPRDLHRLSRGAALDGRREGLLDGVERTTAMGWQVLDLHTAALFRAGQGAVNQVAAVPSLHAAFSRWWRCSSGTGCSRAGDRCCGLPAGDGPDADGHRRALLLRRRARLGLRRRRDGRLGRVGTAPGVQVGLRQRRT